VKNLKNDLHIKVIKDHRLYENVSLVVYAQVHKHIMRPMWLVVDNQVLNITISNMKVLE